MRIEKLYHPEGGASGFDLDFAKRCHDTQLVFQHREFEEFFWTTSMWFLSTPHWKYIVYDDDDRIIASMAFIEDSDLHVGKCLTLVLGHNTDASRPLLYGGWRWMYEIAKEKGIPFVIYSKNYAPFKYDVVYRRVK